MRSRNLKPGFFKNEDLVELPPLARLLFQGLWCMADREGRLEDRPKKIKIEILPCDNCNITAFLNALQDKGFILRYSQNNNKYIQITNFKKHQNPHMKEAESAIPAPDLHHASTVQTPTEHGVSPADSLYLIPDSLTLNPDIPIKDIVGLPADASNSLNVQTLAKLWNEKAPPELSKVNVPFKRSPKAMTIIKDALKRNPEEDWWIRVIERVHQSPFLRGEKGWKASIDFVIGKAEEILDGKYDGSKRSPAASGAVEWLESRRGANESG